MRKIPRRHLPQHQPNLNESSAVSMTSLRPLPESIKAAKLSTARLEQDAAQITKNMLQYCEPHGLQSHFLTMHKRLAGLREQRNDLAHHTERRFARLLCSMHVRLGAHFPLVSLHAGKTPRKQVYLNSFLSNASGTCGECAVRE